MKQRFCKDCKYFKLGLLERLLGWKEFGKCTHETAVREGGVNNVTGEKYPDTLSFAINMRIFECGPNGKYYVKRVKK